MIRLEVQYMNHDSSRLSVLCNAGQLISLYFMLVQYCFCGLKIKTKT